MIQGVNPAARIQDFLPPTPPSSFTQGCLIHFSLWQGFIFVGFVGLEKNQISGGSKDGLEMRTGAEELEAASIDNRLATKANREIR